MTGKDRLSFIMNRRPKDPKAKIRADRRFKSLFRSEKA
jgi:hypothetical protein